MRLALLPLALIALISCCSDSVAPPDPEPAVGAVTVSIHVQFATIWARTSLPPHKNSAAFLSLNNTGAESLRLLSASTPRAGVTELHTMELVDERMKMRRVEFYEIPVGGELVLEPGGNHLMFFELDQPWEAGETIPITLTFSDDVVIKVQAVVKPL